MQFSTLPLAVVAALAASLAIAQSTITVNTPTTLITCQPVQLTWTGGTAPYFPRITAGGDISTTLNAFDTTSSNTITWTVNIASGTSVTFSVTDSDGASNSSAEVTIQSGSTSCLGGSGSGASSTGGAGGSSSASSASSSGSSSASSSSAAASSSAASSSRASTSSAAATSSSAPTTSSSSTAPAATSAAASGAESLRGFPAAVAGLVGIVAAALL